MFFMQVLGNIFLKILIILALCLPQFLKSEEVEIQYAVKFLGTDQPDLTQLLQESSQLIKLQKHPPKTEASLRRRTESDIPNLVKALHSYAYYNAKVQYQIDLTRQPHQVTFHIDTGPVYPFGSFEVFPEDLKIHPKDLGISLGSPGYSSEIFAAEETLLHVLTRKSFPLAKLLERKVIADQKTKQLHVKLYVDPGPMAYFGETSIIGNCSVKDEFIKKKINWRYGEVFDPTKVDCTVDALESAGVFSSISITHSGEANEEGTLPMAIQVVEGKQRSIGVGVGYSTQRGPGFTGEWEHRNYRGKGEKLRVNANVLKDTQEGSVTYLIPDFLRRNQDLIYAAEVEHNDTKGFEMTSFSLSGILERQLSNHTRASIGGMYEFLRTTEENKNGNKNTASYNLARIPMKYKWTNVDDPLDPTSGAMLFMKAVPTFQLVDETFFYTITSLTASIYQPLSREKKWILAAKASFGSIWGTSRNVIPGSDRLYAGSENTLRGYNYYTVSPISEDGDPIGGRGLMIYTLEGRWHATEQWGGVLFYDVGNVFSTPYPVFDKKMLQSTGIGIRYFTPVGPLRLDVAFPLNRRKIFDNRRDEKRYIDNAYQIYFSVGQSF
jgi:translocation and assembly module TamA